MKKSIFLILSLLSFLVLANTSNAQDAKASTILDNVQKKYFSLKSSKMSFNVGMTNAQGKNLGKKSGTILLKGAKYRINMTGETIINDGKANYLYNKSYNEVQITNANDIGKDFLGIFVSLDKELLNKYTLNYEGIKTLNGIQCDLVKLTPKSSTTYKYITLFVDLKQSIIRGATFVEKNGNVYNISSSNFSPNANIADAEFVFNEGRYPGVEIIDLR